MSFFAQQKLWAYVAIAITIVTGFYVATERAETSTAIDPIPFGMNSGSIDALVAEGLKPDYASMWIGSWTLGSGWGGPDKALDKAKANGVSPMIQFYYWGDDISRECLEDGCDSGLHGARKNQTQWQRLARELADHLNARLQGSPAVIVLETEFNKGDVATYEPLDEMLEAKARFFREEYPAAKLVLGFGNWASANWGTFDRAAAASDYAGLQAMRGSTRNSLDSYHGIWDSTLSGAMKLKAIFQKPVFLTDIALSTYPEPSYLEHQAYVVKEFFTRRAEFLEAGVRAVVYRSLLDTPTMDLANYYGEAERHWGLSWANGTHKPAFAAWAEGILNPQGHDGPAEEPPASTALAPDGVLRVEVEAFHSKPVGGAERDETASGGNRWNLWANGVVSHRLEVGTPGAYRFLVWASGRELDGVAPTMTLGVDGRTVSTASVRSGPYRAFGASLELSAGSHAIQIGYTNDAKSSTGDRNLLVDRILVQGVEKIQAEEFESKSTGARQDCSSCSGDAYWNLWANGALKQPVSFPEAGQYELRVRARGTTLGGVPPHLVVSLDDRAVGSADPGATAWTEPSFRLDVTSAGSHTVSLAFTNDARTATEDRNLWLDKLEIRRVG